MGKFERGYAEEIELDVVDLLNNKMDQEKCHPRNRHSITLAKRIIDDYENILSATFTGRHYDIPGDITLNLANGNVVHVELKLVKSVSSKGTRANIGQDSLTDFGLFVKGTLSWSEYRARNDFDGKVFSTLSKYQYYPHSISKDKESMARYLRDRIKEISRSKAGESIEVTINELAEHNANGEIKEAAEIVQEILKLARNDKLGYIEYLRSRGQNPDNIKKFTILLLSGFHKHSTITRGFKGWDNLVRSIMHRDFKYVTYYVEKRYWSIRKEDLSNLIQTLIKVNDFRIAFPKNEINVFIEYRDPNFSRWERLLRIVFHWKNIFQGIATPCLNIFDDGILKRL